MLPAALRTAGLRTAPLLAAAVLLAGCGNEAETGAGTASGGGGGGAAESEPLNVVAAFYPLQFAAAQVGGDDVKVDNLVPPGVEPHDLELTAQQVGTLQDADLVLYLAQFQPAVDEAVADVDEAKKLDAATIAPLEEDYVPLEEGELHEDEKGKDPHVWLDPTRMAGIVDAVAERLGKADPDNAAEYTSRAEALGQQLAELDTQFRTGLANCESKDIVVSHNAFGYLASRYGLRQVPITGLTPEEDPSPARVAEVADFARKNNVKTIFFESLVSPKIAQTIADEVGAKTAVLDPVEGVEDGETYLSVMEDNLAALRTALGCS